MHATQQLSVVHTEDKICHCTIHLHYNAEGVTVEIPWKYMKGHAAKYEGITMGKYKEMSVVVSVYPNCELVKQKQHTVR